MKKLIFTSLFLLSLVFGLQAQMLATFENGTDDNLYLCDYGTCGDPFWYDNGRFVEGGLPQIGANPSKSGINTSERCLMAVNAADADWWGNFAVLELHSPVVITEANRYLHLKVYRSIQPKNFRIGFNDREEATEIFQGKVASDAKWEHLVCDLGAKFMGQELRYLHFIWSTNWSDPRTGWGVATYAFDDIALNSSSLPPDAVLLDGNNLHVGFENQAETDQWVKEIDLLNTGNSMEIIDNPFAESSVDSKGKILKFNKGADASWWQGCRFDFNGIMAAGGTGNPQYLHTLVYVPSTVLTGDMMNIDIQLCAKDHMNNENTELFTVWDDEMDEWIDLVMEINRIEYLKELTVRYDLRKEGSNYINSPANTYYLDDIVFNRDQDPRTHIETGIKLPAVSTLAKITTADGAILISTAKNAQIQVYNIVGRLIHSAQDLKKVELPVEKGVYVVNIIAGGEKQTAKVLVK